ncbi:MAG TPA: TrkA family potassium uptake protein [Chloroflexia bacterium]|nr:TrkA family potassium uptake protein [Chloroflexia bacterium]
MARGDYAVIGLGRFGSAICRTLRALGHDVLGIDTDMDLVQRMRPFLTDAVQADATDVDALRGLDIASYDAVVVAIGTDFENAILATLALKELGVSRVLAKAGTATEQQVLAKLGADLVVFPEDDAGYRVAHNLVYPNISDFVDLGEDYLILEVSVKPEWEGRSPAQLGMSTGSSRIGAGGEYAGLQIQLLRRGKRLICLPDPEMPLAHGDVLVLVGTHRDLAGLQR